MSQRRYVKDYKHVNGNGMYTPDSQPSIRDLKDIAVDAGGAEHSFGQRADLIEHLQMLEREFSGRSQLEFFHAATIVFIRRNLNRPNCVDNFWSMWRLEADFLLNKLDSRWLVSACDTIMDTADDPYEVAVAGAASLFMNTIKLYETERMALEATDLVLSVPSISHRRTRTDLFDGLTAFNIGTGEMISNLFDRLNTGLDNGALGTQILKELIRRANEHDTVLKRLADIHVRPATRW